MKRINISCSTKDKENIFKIFRARCPFDPLTDECDDYTQCKDCINNNIEVEIIEQDKVLTKSNGNIVD